MRLNVKISYIYFPFYIYLFLFFFPSVKTSFTETDSILYKKENRRKNEFLWRKLLTLWANKKQQRKIYSAASYYIANSNCSIITMKMAWRWSPDFRSAQNWKIVHGHAHWSKSLTDHFSKSLSEKTTKDILMKFW